MKIYVFAFMLWSLVACSPDTVPEISTPSASVSKTPASPLSSALPSPSNTMIDEAPGQKAIPSTPPTFLSESEHMRIDDAMVEDVQNNLRIPVSADASNAIFLQYIRDRRPWSGIESPTRLLLHGAFDLPEDPMLRRFTYHQGLFIRTPEKMPVIHAVLDERIPLKITRIAPSLIQLEIKPFGVTDFQLNGLHLLTLRYNDEEVSVPVRLGRTANDLMPELKSVRGLTEKGQLRWLVLKGEFFMLNPQKHRVMIDGETYPITGTQVFDDYTHEFWVDIDRLQRKNEPHILRYQTPFGIFTGKVKPNALETESVETLSPFSTTMQNTQALINETLSLNGDGEWSWQRMFSASDQQRYVLSVQKVNPQEQISTFSMALNGQSLANENPRSGFLSPGYAWESQELLLKKENKLQLDITGEPGARVKVLLYPGESAGVVLAPLNKEAQTEVSKQTIPVQETLTTFHQGSELYRAGFGRQKEGLPYKSERPYSQLYTQLSIELKVSAKFDSEAFLSAYSGQLNQIDDSTYLFEPEVEAIPVQDPLAVIEEFLRSDQEYNWFFSNSEKATSMWAYALYLQKNNVQITNARLQREDYGIFHPLPSS